ncbi:substrate-binding periplasmic protein [Thalassolituus sp. LLYu03]|uniref:substrate-binding periplasmic protein n=1 Tax=Thalassolituus sp. LLYu03 TaxID=3421656 RepID=UPI003D269AFB
MRAVFCAFLLIFLSLSVRAECTALTASGNAEYPPYLWRASHNSDALDGAITRLMTTLGERIGIPVQMQFVGPWGRTQEEVANGNIDLIAGAFYTQARSERMDYIRPAFQETRSVLWVRNDNVFAYSRLDDLVGKRGVTVINNSFGQAFDEFAKAHLEILQVGGLEQALRMISNGRVDYLVYEEQPGLAYIERARIDNLQMLDVPVSSEALYLTMSCKSACNTPALKERISAELELMRQEGLMDQYLELARGQWQGQ